MFPPPNAPNSSFPYLIEGLVGQGAMGKVYRAKETTLDRTVAIKAIREDVLPADDPAERSDVYRRFLQEARAAAALSHPGITTVFRVGEENGVPFLVTEWLEGRSLDEHIAEHGPLTESEAARILVELLEALDVAHRHGVVHRDIKPANLMLLNDGRVKVTDFGIARMQGRELVKTQVGTILATPKFAAPEQLQGLEVDGRADLFAAGILLFHLLTGDYPFAGKTFADLASAILHQAPRSLRELRPQTHPALLAIVDRALRKDRQQRFPTATEMAAQLRPLSLPANDAAPTLATPIPTAQAAPKSESATVVQGLPQDPALALVAMVDSWPGQQLSGQRTAELVDRLLEKPLHAPAFAGAAVLAKVCLFFYDGLLLGAVDTVTGRCGDRIAETLPATVEAKLLPVPDGLSPRIVPLMTSLLRPAEIRHGDLDAAFINLPAMARKLGEEKFDGLFRLRRGAASGWALFDRGEIVANLYTEGWDSLPVDQSWSHWVGDAQVTASVENMTSTPLGLWYRRRLRDLELVVEPVAEAAVEDSTTLITRRGSRSVRLPTPMRVMPGASTVQGFHQAPIYRFLDWALAELPGFFAERERTARWKYLAEWLPLIRSARLHHRLLRPGSADFDRFDLVTLDTNAKVLHLGEYLSQPTPASLTSFIDRAIAAKVARKKSGDVGGAFVIAPGFDEATLEVYRQAIAAPAQKGWFGMEESLTGYEGFIRIGPRRGFHLLLVTETGGTFRPLLPG